MKKTILPFFTFLFLLTAHYSYAMNYCDYYADPTCGDERCNFYAEVFAGPNRLETRKNNSVHVDFDTGYMVSGSYGYRMCYGFRFEIEYAYRRNLVEKVHFNGETFKSHGKFRSSAAMANLLWTLPFDKLFGSCWGLQPFIGAGVGYDAQKLKTENFAFHYLKQKKQFAWQAMGGISYQFACSMQISVEYRYHQGSFKHLYSHTLGAGLTYNFWPLLPY